MRLKEVDGKGGNQDRSLSSDAVISPATLKITKNANPPGNTSFPFTTSAASGTGLTPSTFSLVDDGVDPGVNVQSYPSITNFTDYTIRETPIPSGWSLTDLTCIDPDSETTTNSGTATAVADVDEAEDVECTFTNTRNQGEIKVVKDFVGAPSTATADLNIDGTQAKNEALDTEGSAFVKVDTGQHSVSEDDETRAGTSLADYTSSVACNDQNDARQVGHGTSLSDPGRQG